LGSFSFVSKQPASVPFFTQRKLFGFRARCGYFQIPSMAAITVLGIGMEDFQLLVSRKDPVITGHVKYEMSGFFFPLDCHKIELAINFLKHTE
jgi:hypothetical protein